MTEKLNSVPDIEAQKVLRIIDYYGTRTETVVAIEEMAELTQELTKILRYGEPRVEGLTEEIADVLICIEELRTMYNVRNKDLTEAIHRKLDRQLERIRRGEG